MRKLYFLLVSSLCLLAVVGASAAEPVFKKGSGSYEYTGYAPLKDKPVTLLYYIPEGGDVKAMPVLFVMHGNGRNGKVNLEAWKPFADIKNFVVLVPTFTNEYYSSRLYHLGGVSEKGSTYVAVPEEKWTYNIIESIFDFFKAQTGNTNAAYDIWGHSAGAQFTHRFLLAMPNARVNRAVVANAGWWTVPNPDGIKNSEGEVFPWPASVKGSPFADEAHLKSFFARKLTISLGTEDNDPNQKDLTRTPPTMAQGKNRVERGNYFYKVSKEVAKKNGWPFNWEIYTVKGVEHSTAGMVYGYPGDVVDGKTTYNTANYGKGGGYWILYADR